MSLNSPLVSVIIPAYNCARYLPAAIESALGQTYPAVEIIVVNDGSTDETSEVLSHYSSIISIQQKNCGLSYARNRGIERARGEYIALLDGDDIWPETKLTDQVELMSDNPAVGVLFGDARRFADNGWTEPTLFTRYQLNDKFFGSDFLVIDALKKLLFMNFIPVGTALVRKECLIEAGLFDETFRRVEDWDMWLRIALRDKFAYSRKLWKLKRTHETNLSNNTEAMALSAIAVMEKLVSEHGPELLELGIDVDPHLRDAYSNLGYFYLRALSLFEARKALSASLKCGTQPRSALYWLSTFFGKNLVRALLHARN
jgi:glycosyltransferase involved in cell wall biosynthesis